MTLQIEFQLVHKVFIKAFKVPVVIIRTTCRKIKKLCISPHIVQYLWLDSSWNVMVHDDGRERNAVGRQYPSHYLGTWGTQHYYRWCAHLGWTDAHADLNGLVRFAERQNLISARVPSHFNWPVPYGSHSSITSVTLARPHAFTRGILIANARSRSQATPTGICVQRSDSER
jgi:hypothetical protein